MAGQCEGYSPEDTQREWQEFEEECARQWQLDVLMTSITHCLECTKEPFYANDTAGYLWTLCPLHKARMQSFTHYM